MSPPQKRIAQLLLLPKRSQFLQSRNLQIPRRSNPSTPSPSGGRISRPRTQTRKFQTSARRVTDKPNPTPNTKADVKPKPDQRSRLESVLSRLPRPLRRYTSGLRSAPLSHVIAFLILHEITAIVPLLGLFGLFHYFSSSSSTTTATSSSSAAGERGESWLPIGYILDHYGNYVQDGVTRFEKYFTKKGWFGFGDDAAAQELAHKGGQSAGQEQEGTHAQAVIQKWEQDRTSDPKYRILVEMALAYALTKALLPVRIVASVSATPWFAGVLARLRTFITRRKP